MNKNSMQDFLCLIFISQISTTNSKLWLISITLTKYFFKIIEDLTRSQDEVKLKTQRNKYVRKFLSLRITAEIGKFEYGVGVIK